MFFAISDIHGHYKQFVDLLTHWNPDDEQLIILGDLIDRGPDSKKVINKAKQLEKKYGAITLMGNHEQMFLEWVLATNEVLSKLYYSDYYRSTLQSYGLKITSPNEASDAARIMRERFAEDIDFLSSLKPYYDTENALFVHAGINLDRNELSEMGLEDFLWIRNEFHFNDKIPKKTVYFGHTPTFLLNKNKEHTPWVSSCRRKVGIDGGCFKTGTLNGVKINDLGEVEKVFQS